MADDSSRYNVAMIRLPILEGSLVTISDLRSDQRFIINSNRSGALQSFSTLDVPVAFIASAPNLGLISAIVKLDTEELIVYRIRHSQE